MILVVTTAIIAIWALAFSSVDPNVMAPLIAAAGAGLALAALAAPRTRRQMDVLLRRHAIAAGGFILMLAACAVIGGQTAQTLRTVTTLLGIALAAPAAAAIATAYGRNAVALGLLIGAIPLAFAGLLTFGLALTGPLGRFAPALDAPAFTAGFGLMALLAIHTAADELRRRPAPGARALPPLARRLFAPVAAMMTSFAMLTLSGATAALAATAVGALVFAAALWSRARKSRVGAAVVPAVIFVSAGSAALAVVAAALGAGLETPAMSAAPAPQSGIAHWLAQAGFAGVALLGFVFAALIAVLAVSKDRGRTPSRGAPLLGAVAAYAVIVSWFAPAFAAPAAALLLAIVTGLAASYLDPQSERTPRSA